LAIARALDSLSVCVCDLITGATYTDEVGCISDTGSFSVTRFDHVSLDTASVVRRADCTRVTAHFTLTWVILRSVIPGRLTGSIDTRGATWRLYTATDSSIALFVKRCAEPIELSLGEAHVNRFIAAANTDIALSVKNLTL
jgi:hypothetical protein